MSNERIDLTQDELRDTLYDWMTKGYKPQMAIPDDLPNEISEILFAIEHLGLIAELKRCYEELDKANKEGEALWNVLDNWDICMDDYSMHDQYENLDEKYDRDNEGRIILKELYSYTEEDGWQPEESASE